MRREVENGVAMDIQIGVRIGNRQTKGFWLFAEPSNMNQIQEAVADHNLQRHYRIQRSYQLGKSPEMFSMSGSFVSQTSAGGSCLLTLFGLLGSRLWARAQNITQFKIARPRSDNKQNFANHQTYCLFKTRRTMPKRRWLRQYNFSRGALIPGSAFKDPICLKRSLIQYYSGLNY